MRIKQLKGEEGAGEIYIYILTHTSKAKSFFFISYISFVYNQVLKFYVMQKCF